MTPLWVMLFNLLLSINNCRRFVTENLAQFKLDLKSDKKDVKWVEYAEVDSKTEKKIIDFLESKGVKYPEVTVSAPKFKVGVYFQSENNMMREIRPELKKILEGAELDVYDVPHKSRKVGIESVKVI